MRVNAFKVANPQAGGHAIGFPHFAAHEAFLLLKNLVGAGHSDNCIDPFFSLFGLKSRLRCCSSGQFTAFFPCLVHFRWLR
jgi:hypothetical protein